MSKQKITECPICGGQLQMTRVYERHFDCEEFVFDGRNLDFYEGPVRFPLDDEYVLIETRLSCEYEHTQAEMEDALYDDPGPPGPAYYQPENAGDPDCGTSAADIPSFGVYRSKVNAKVRHPDCRILAFQGDDIEEPTFLDESTRDSRAYLGTVHVLIEPGICHSQADACDWFTGLLTGNPEVLDWSYLNLIGNRCYPTERPIDREQYQEGDFLR